MKDELREQLEIALRRLPIGPEAKAQLPEMVTILASFKGKLNIRTPPHFLKIGKTRAKKELHKVSTLATSFADYVTTLHEPTVVALANQGLLTHQLERSLRSVAAAAAKASPGSMVSEKPVKGRPEKLGARAIAGVVAANYKALTGKKPTVSTDWRTGKMRGPFYELMSEIFRLLEVDASPEASIRNILKTRKGEKQPKHSD